MDKIYSRKRIKIPKVKRTNVIKVRKIYFVFLIWIIMIVSMVMTLKLITPIFEEVCKGRCKKIGTEIVNTESTNVLRQYTYDDFVVKDKTEDGEINQVSSNILNINFAASDIAYNIQQKLKVLEKEEIKIPIGSFLGIPLFSGTGPSVTIKIVPAGSVDTKFESEFITAGVNQTLHRLYLVVDCRVVILTNYKIMDATIRNEVLFAEDIIKGDVPQSYYNLEGMKSDDVLEVVN